MSHHRGFYSSATQVEWACRALLSGRFIGQGDKIAEANGWRLAAIVWRLTHRYCWPIDMVYGGLEQHTQYKLRPGFDRSKLRFPPSAQNLGQGGEAWPR